MLERKISEIKSNCLDEIKNSSDKEELYNVKVKYLGRRGKLTEIIRKLKDLSVGDKKKIGKLANKVKKKIEDEMARKNKELEQKVDWEKERIDVTIPGEKADLGSLHPLTLAQRDIGRIFTSMGFEIADGPEVEMEWYNFDALNMPPDHPARDMQDTFWVKSDKEKLVLRTHTSNVQVRYMRKHKPPIRIIVPGRVFRNEATDASHDHTFYQFEGLMVEKNVNAANFKFIIKTFFSKFFNKDVGVRLRPGYFPFTEPSFEIDISCTVCEGAGCSTCKQSGWLEIAGAGMVHQKVFEAAGYPKNRHQGFAFGASIDRLAMMKYKINDIRLFHGGDLRFVEQF